ncbi:TOM1-like protein 6 [Curcuma longa]|uniref:TOM1-like protein 6 n=1 Tax=Curcuma longa TaxID=136217 RepID=UPI003D9EF9A9
MSSSSSVSATVRVEKATSDLLMGPDWTLNMDICDSVNSDHWQAKDVVKALKKRLQHKNPQIQFLSLTLLETMIKNCGDYVHFQVVEREIPQEMVKIVRKKTDMQVRDKILALLDSWQEAFGGAGGKYPQFYWAYTDLKRSGVHFPERSPDSTLIFTPVHSTSGIRQPPVGYGMPSNSVLRLEEAMASEMANLSLSDLASMRSVMDLLNEMLKAVNPSDRSAVKDEVIVDLVDQCRSNQKKLMESLNLIRDEELLGQGLELNDDLQNVLAKNDAIASGSPLPADTSELITQDHSVAPQPTETELSESLPSPRTPIVPQPSSRYNDEEEDEDDDFAQLARRNSKVKPLSSDGNFVATNNHSGSPNRTDVTNSGIAGSIEASSPSSASNTLALPDPPAPVNTFTKEDDIINLLSITLPSSSPPHTPLTPPVTSDQNVSSPPIPPAPRVNPATPLSNAVNQAYPENNFIAPWAQTQIRPTWSHPQPQFEQFSYSSSYPPPPWATAPVDRNADADANPFGSTTFQYPAPVNSSAATYPSIQVPKPSLQYSFGSGVNNVPSTTAWGNTSHGQTGPPAAKPYVYTNRLFDELDLRNTSTGRKTSTPTSGLSGTPGQGMISGGK